MMLGIVTECAICVAATARNTNIAEKYVICLENWNVCYQDHHWRDLADNRGRFSLYVNMWHPLEDMLDRKYEGRKFSSSTVPMRRAAQLAFTLNWFSMSFGRKAANPAIRSPSLAPARFRKKKVGLAMRLRNARGSSLILVKASILLFPWASDTFSACSAAAPQHTKCSLSLTPTVSRMSCW